MSSSHQPQFPDVEVTSEQLVKIPLIWQMVGLSARVRPFGVASSSDVRLSLCLDFPL